MRLRNETITLGLKRKALEPTTYKLIDNNNVRIGSKWFQFQNIRLEVPKWGLPKFWSQNGVTIYHGCNAKQFISNSWFDDINTDEL